MSLPPPIEPDSKDWTWVLERPCPECGFVAGDVPVERLPETLLENAAAWVTALAAPDVHTRPSSDVWSVLEYACHVRDVHRVYAGRVGRMLTEVDPHYENWDQDATAVEERYAEQDPATVAEELAAAGDELGSLFEGVEAEGWERTGRRSDGACFTVDSIGRYYLHDIEHHLWDVRPGVDRPVG
jgi:hypothetical protein